MEYLLSKNWSKKILFLGVSMKTKGGMTSVLISYDKYIDGMRFIPTWRLGNKLVKVWYALQSVIRTLLILIFDNNIKVVHIHGAANASFYRCQLFINLSKFFNKKVILHEHAADFAEFFDECNDKLGIIQTLNNCDKMIVLSESWRKYFEGIGVLPPKLVVLNNIVQPPSFPEVSANPRNDNRIRLLFLGEISNRKGAYDLLKALNRDQEYFRKNILVKIAGNLVDGNIKQSISEMGLDDFVTYEGWIAGEKKIESLVWTDIYILPSYNEGLPIAILEAMSYSHPIISTTVGGIPEIVESMKNGILINPGDIDALNKAIRYYIDHPEEIEEHGKVSYRKVGQYFPDNVFNVLKQIYLSVL